jgi:predicted ArsR family transcriptional regulator
MVMDTVMLAQGGRLTVDREMLELIAARTERRPGLKVDEAAADLGCSEVEARERLDALVQSGLAVGPWVQRWGDQGEWREGGYGLSSQGRDVLSS